LLERAISLNQNRFNYHHIEVEERLLSDFHQKGASNLLLSSFSNIIDNAIYWMDYKAEIIGAKEHYRKKMFIAIDTNSFDGPAVMFADSGYGFEMDAESLVQPYKTLKPDGMGLGLYYVDLVMQSIGGKLLFPDISMYNVPADYCGAFVVLVFPKKS
jgi:nitrogen fixation/metabolism regulation signal transduction histidine kinase